MSGMMRKRIVAGVVGGVAVGVPATLIWASCWLANGRPLLGTPESSGMVEGWAAVWVATMVAAAFCAGFPFEESGK